MLVSIRESVGLGSPPSKYTTNSNESMNNVAKAHVNYHKLAWTQLNDNMFTLVTGQFKEVEKAVYGMGEYQFTPDYGHFEVKNSKWFLMTKEQCQKHLKKLFDGDCYPLLAKKTTSSAHKSLSVSPEEAGIVSLSSELIQRMWAKAERLLNISGSICNAPGMKDTMCVASDTGTRPHVITLSKKGVLVCDDACMAWKSQRIAHMFWQLLKQRGVCRTLYYHFGDRKLLPIIVKCVRTTCQRVLAVNLETQSEKDLKQGSLK